MSGIEYQQGTLQGYEVKEYLLERDNYKCCYCGATDVPLEVEHITPESRGGSNRVDNLCIACVPCNKKKGNMTAEEFGYSNIQKLVLKPLRDTALINATRWKVYEVLTTTSLSVECGTGAKTKMNRLKMGLLKEHYYDACCIGESTPDKLRFKAVNVLHIKVMGRGQYRRTNVDNSGFPRGYLLRQKQFFGFQTGDMVKAVVPKGKNTGIWFGRTLCRRTGSFDIKTILGRNAGINYKYLKLIQNNDGYEYKIALSSPCLKAGASSA
jgi:hypothetical protein